MSNEINLRPVDLSKDPIGDKCAPLFENNCTAAVLEINGINIPLCLTRLQSLIDAINKFVSTIFCYKCDHFIMSPSGWSYGGSCKCQAQQHNDMVTELTAGYKYCVDCMHTCPHAIEKSNQNTFGSNNIATGNLSVALGIDNNANGDLLTAEANRIASYKDGK